MLFHSNKNQTPTFEKFLVLKSEISQQFEAGVFDKQKEISLLQLELNETLRLIKECAERLKIELPHETSVSGAGTIKKMLIPFMHEVEKFFHYFSS